MCGGYSGEHEMNLIRNAIQTPDGTVIESRSRHDYVTHQDANGKEYMVDGGLSYVRRSANGDEISMCLYDDESHEVQRQIIKWGSYGKDGKQPLSFKSVANMDTDHIVAVLENCSPHKVIENCMRKELENRDEC